MKKLFTFLMLLAGLSSPAIAELEFLENRGPHVRIMRNNFDGSRIEFTRTPDSRKLLKKTIDKDGRILMTARYFRNPRGFLTSGEIYDGQGVLLYRVRYGYDKQTGYLRAEDMFDARVKFQRPVDGKMKELPVRRIYYWYDDEGNESKAIALVPKKGKAAEEVFKKKDFKEEDLYNEEQFDPSKSFRPLDPFKDNERK
ncbi:MAG: hypothetical protein ACON5H_04630 [Akkermansiaceae bacterium]